MTRGYLPQKPVQYITENGDPAAIQEALDAAHAAQATAEAATHASQAQEPRLQLMETKGALFDEFLTAYQAQTNELEQTDTDVLRMLDELSSQLDAMTPPDLTAITNRLNSLEQPTAFGVAATPTLALLATADITVNLSRQMPDTSYTVDIARAGGITVDMLTIQSKTRTTVTIRLRATVAVTAAMIAVQTHY